jgi:hypothetical protein
LDRDAIASWKQGGGGGGNGKGRKKKRDEKEENVTFVMEGIMGEN